MRTTTPIKLALLAALLIGAAIFTPAQKRAPAPKKTAPRPAQTAPPRPAPIVRSYIDAVDTITETSIATGQFRKLVAAIGFAEMIQTLKSGGPFTIFAPSDDAFARMPKERLDLLFADKGKMRSFLNSLIVRGKVMVANREKTLKPVTEFADMFTFSPSSVVNLGPTRSLGGTLLNIRSQGDGFILGGAKLARTDLLCSNGVIHVVDSLP
jgi:uncharacterized surface protein with fasciclin (FAS1) repeats